MAKKKMTKKIGMNKKTSAKSTASSVRRTVAKPTILQSSALKPLKPAVKKVERAVSKGKNIVARAAMETSKRLAKISNRVRHA